MSLAGLLSFRNPTMLNPFFFFFFEASSPLKSLHFRTFSSCHFFPEPIILKEQAWFISGPWKQASHSCLLRSLKTSLPGKQKCRSSTHFCSRTKHTGKNKSCVRLGLPSQEGVCEGHIEGEIPRSRKGFKTKVRLGLERPAAVHWATPNFMCSALMSVVTVLGTAPRGDTEIRWNCMPSSHNGNSMLLKEKAEWVFSSFLPAPLLSSLSHLSSVSPLYSSPHCEDRVARWLSTSRGEVFLGNCSSWHLDRPARENTFLFLAPTVSSSHCLGGHSLLGLWDSWDNKHLIFQCRKSWEDRDKWCYDKVSSPGLWVFRKSLNIGGVGGDLKSCVIFIDNLNKHWPSRSITTSSFKKFKTSFIYVRLCLIYLRRLGPFFSMVIVGFFSTLRNAALG